MAVALGVLGCRDYTCVDTATCTYPADAAALADSGDAGSFSGADASGTTSIAPEVGSSLRGEDASRENEADASEAPSPESDGEPAPAVTSGSGSVSDSTASGTTQTPTVDATSPATTDAEVSAPTGDVVPDAHSSVGTASSQSEVAPPTPTTDAPPASSDTSDVVEGGPEPSAGCGKANPQTGSSGQPLNVSNHQYYVKLPTSYDPNNPYKVMIMFNPTGNDINWAETAAGYEQAAADAIRVYPHMANKNNGWQASETSFFQGLYDAITNNFCVDKNAVFAGGESSGGEFAAFLGCEYGDLLRGVAPGAPKLTAWNNTQHECKGHPVAIVIWSPNDTVLSQPAGPTFRDYYAAMNECEETSRAVEGFTDPLSNCEQFDGCLAGSEVYFCEHNDPEYSNTYHGWPRFAASMTWQTFSAL